jgi:hypothetical protein
VRPQEAAHLGQRHRRLGVPAGLKNEREPRATPQRVAGDQPWASARVSAACVAARSSGVAQRASIRSVDGALGRRAALLTAAAAIVRHGRAG